MRRNFSAWDCKVTPASCACQEGNTTGCIPSNDGLDAPLVPGFPHHGKLRTGRVGLKVTTEGIAGSIVAGEVMKKRLGYGPSKCELRGERSQLKTQLNLLIGCGKVEILVQSCGK